MKKTTVVLSVLFLSVSLLNLDIFAQQRKYQRVQGRGMGQQLSRYYEPETVVSIKGVVNDIAQYRYGQGRFYGLHIRLNTENEIYSVHLGPAWYIENEMKIDLNDVLEITGSKVIYNDTLTVIAAQIKKGEQIVQLRNELGIPVWSRSGYGRRRR